LPKTYIEQRQDKTYKAIQNQQIIATGDTQREAIDGARKKKPNDVVLAERVRDTDAGGRDQWRRVY
jgi:hypothetical protein